LPKPPPKPGGEKGASNPLAKKDRFASGYDFLLVNGDIQDSTFPELMGCVQEHRANVKLVLILVTYGGQANAAYRIARFLHTLYEDLVAFIPTECKSAGTLLVTAANSVVISPFGDLGPLDVQLLRRDEIGSRRSGLTTRSALEDLKTHSFELFEHFMYEIIQRSGTAVSFRTAADVASRISARLMSRIYEQINPDALGQDYRDLNIAFKYGERLTRKYGNLKKGALRRLIYDYPSHDFVIDLEEAEEIFERVELPTETLVALMSVKARDCLLVRSGKDRVVEMLTMTGQTLPVEKTADKPSEKPTPRKKATENAPAVEERRNGPGTPAAS
jgi:hypothetical protein